MSYQSRILSIYASDTSGVCSMLYELGGMTVVHDASGCNSTYSTHDEPRWYHMESMIYISALTEKDAILGNDEKFVEDVSSTANTLHPAFIALCGSPMPYMTGTDFDALGEEIRQRTSLPVFALHTNGMGSYIDGASQALKSVVEYFAQEKREKTSAPSVNILGATPLDFSVCGQSEAIRNFLAENGFTVISNMAMGCSIDDIRSCTKAHCNLVISSSGLPAARFLEKEYGIPYVCGVPVGKEFSKALLAALRKGETAFPCRTMRSSGGTSNDTGVLHEAVYASSLACALALEGKGSVRVLTPLEADPELLAHHDHFVPDEKSCMECFRDLTSLVADPMYKPVVPPDVTFHVLVHEAFSGRCYRKDLKNLIAENFNLKEFNIQ